jgi:hypothetical protein
MSLGTDYIVRYLSDISGAIKGAKELETVNLSIAKNIQQQYGEVEKIIGQTQPKYTTTPITEGRFKGLNTEILTTGQIVKTVNGSFLELSKTQTSIHGQLVKTTSGMKDVTNQFTQTSIGAAKADKGFKSMLDNLIRLGARAVLTIPIWQALRAVMGSTMAIFTEGFRDLVSESLALDKAKKSLEGTAEAIAVSYNKLKTETESLSLETGVSQEKIISVFQKFKSVGFDFATSMTAANAVTKLSIITQSDAVVASEGLSHALFVLIDRNASVVDQQKQVNDVISLTSEVVKSGGINIEEFVGSLEKFAITGKSVNFTTNQTIALLATLSKSGLGSTGNLLRNSIGQLLNNLDKLAGSLGIKVNPALDNTFSILMKVLGELNKLQKTQNLKGLEQASDAFKEIFGGTRSAVPIKALTSLYDELNKYLSLAPDISAFNNSFADSEKVLGNVVARYHAVNAEIGKGFVNGLIGAEDFDKSLNKIVETLNKIQKHSEDAGKAINTMFNVHNLPIAQVIDFGKAISPKAQADLRIQIADQIHQAFEGALSKEDLSTLFNKLLKIQTFKINIGITDTALNDVIKNIRGQLLASTKATTQAVKEQAKEESKVADILLKKADFTKLEGYAKNELKMLGLSEVEVERRILEFRTLSGQFSEKDLLLQKELLTHLQTIENIELNRTRARGLIDNATELLKLQGATTLQVLQYTIAEEKANGLNQSRDALLRNEINLQKEITKEKLNQNKLSSDSLKLFEISQKYGNQTATTISELLSGKINISAFESPGSKFSDIMPILQEFFAAEVAQMQAQKFFFEGKGTSIPISEKTAIENIKPIDLSSIKLPDINTQVSQINIEIKKLFKEEDTAKQIIDSLLEAIRSNPAIENAINEKIDEF